MVVDDVVRATVLAQAAVELRTVTVKDKLVYATELTICVLTDMSEPLSETCNINGLLLL